MQFSLPAKMLQQRFVAAVISWFFQIRDNQPTCSSGEPPVYSSLLRQRSGFRHKAFDFNPVLVHLFRSEIALHRIRLAVPVESGISFQGFTKSVAASPASVRPACLVFERVIFTTMSPGVRDMNPGRSYFCLHFKNQAGSSTITMQRKPRTYFSDVISPCVRSECLLPGSGLVGLSRVKHELPQEQASCAPTGMEYRSRSNMGKARRCCVPSIHCISSMEALICNSGRVIGSLVYCIWTFACLLRPVLSGRLREYV